MQHKWKKSYASKFKKIGKLGEGTYGIVYKAMSPNNQIVAMKKIRNDDDDEGLSSTTIREIALLKDLNHPNIVQLYDVIVENTKCYLIFEYCTNDLKKHLNKFKNKLSEFQIKNYLYQILQATHFCHKSRVFHRDLKPQNILINENTDVVKLADFGLARTFTLPDRTYSHEVVTLWYRSPEILLGCHTYSAYIDIWSIGCIFAEMSNNSTPLFCGDSEICQLMHIFRLMGTPNKFTWPCVQQLPCFNKLFPQWRPKRLNNIVPNLDNLGQDLISRMLVLYPQNRISAKMSLSHPYFDELKDNM